MQFHRGWQSRLECAEGKADTKNRFCEISDSNAFGVIQIGFFFDRADGYISQLLPDVKAYSNFHD